MARGMSLHVGVNRVDPAAYGGWSGTLRGCEFDATDLQGICAANGFSTRTLLSERATAEAVLEAVDEAAGSLGAGDVFVLTYSGHGGRQGDLDRDEPDGVDETWVLHDRQLLDDELYERWGAFAAGARVVVVSDSCHAGSVISAAPVTSGGTSRLESSAADVKAMPEDLNLEDNARRQDVYAAVKATAPAERDVELRARVLLLAGCQDQQVSKDGARNGRFTAALRLAWDDGAFRGGYRRLLGATKRRMPRSQMPNYFPLNDPRGAFAGERPFSIDGGRP